MARIDIDGIGIAYELLGDAGAPIALTPGGRSGKDTPGLHELAAALVAGGRRVLLWDRPNCGASDISFAADSESDLQARTLIGLVRALGLAPITLAGGSAGSRVSLMAAARDPAAVADLALWWISGGPLCLLQLAFFYCVEPAFAANAGGMAAVAAGPGWAEQIATDPRHRDTLLRHEPRAFIETMQRWATFYLPAPDSPVPGMTPADFARLTMPVVVFRNGDGDLSHPPSTSEAVHRLIPHSTLVEAPWPDTEFSDRAAAAQTAGRGLFEGWPALAPALLALTAAA